MTDRAHWVYTGFMMLLIAALLGFILRVYYLTITRPAYTVESCTEVVVKRGAP